jgi:hypothetical protein
MDKSYFPNFMAIIVIFYSQYSNIISYTPIMRDS